MNKDKIWSINEIKQLENKIFFLLKEQTLKKKGKNGK